MTRVEGTATRPVTRTSMGIAALSTIVEWYDFTLYLYFVTVLSRVFFGEGETSLASTLAGFAIAYMMRPLGAVAFGHFGDRHGRRRAMLASMALMTAAMFATALLPTYAQIGALAPVLLIALRCVMAFAVGGEYTGVVAYLMEGAHPERRGFVTSLAAASSEVGALLAAAAAALATAYLAPAALDSWGWRLPFLLGGVMALAVLAARMRMEESPEFLRQQEAQSVPRIPALHSLRRSGPGIARGFAIGALGSISYYVGITYVPAFLVASETMGEADALLLATIVAVVVIAVTPFVGLAADRFGRRPVLVAVTLGCAALPTAMFSLLPGASFAVALAGAAVLAALGGGVSAVGAVATAELLEGEGRLSGLALGATVATAIFGGLAPYLAEVWTRASGMATVPGLMIAAVALGVLPVLWRMPETRPAVSPPPFAH